MTAVLDSGGVTGLALHRGRILGALRRAEWPPLVPSVVLVECLTGDHRRDFEVERFIRSCEVVDTDQRDARVAARLRTGTGRAHRISAVDALVVALAERTPRPVVITSDPDDMRALVAQTPTSIEVQTI